MPQECSCKYCGKKFKAQRYLETHINKGKECRTLRGVLFFCLRCSCFHTTKFGELENHLLSCKEDGRIFDTLESYNSKIAELQCKIRYLEETKSTDNSNTKKSDNFKDILDKTFGKLQTDNDNVNNYFNSKYMEINNMKNFTRILKKIKKQRRAIFKKGDINAYKYLIKMNLEKLTDVLTTKKISNKKQRKIINNHFTALDLRLMRYEGYEKLSPDGSLLKELDLVLSCYKKPKLFSYDIISIIQNYSVCILPIKTILKIILLSENTYNYVYIDNNECTTKDPYKFYFLSKQDKEINFWEMDCRMLNFCNTFLSLIIPYMIKVFKKNYLEIFHDNIYRSDFLEKLMGLEPETRQILQNLLILSNYKNFSVLSQDIVIKNNRKSINYNDKLNLLQDDPIIDKIQEDNSISNFSQLFEDINTSDINNLIASIS
jgi:hypothetical protein